MLREVPEALRPQVAQAVAAVSGVTHPKLLKVLGMVSDQSRSYVASEYIPGVSLFELIATTRARSNAMATAAAVRVIIDALRLVSEARALLQRTAKPAGRLLHADCIWIADCGEALLAEAGVSAFLAAGSSSEVDSEAQDMLTGAVELFHLASARLITGDVCASAKIHLSAPLSKVLESVFQGDPGAGFESAQGFAGALSAMPPVLVGNEALVAMELERLIADSLDARRRKLASFHDGASSALDIDGPTHFFGAVTGKGDEADEATRAYQRAPSPSRSPPTNGGSNAKSQLGLQLSSLRPAPKLDLAHLLGPSSHSRLAVESRARAHPQESALPRPKDPWRTLAVAPPRLPRPAEARTWVANVATAVLVLLCVTLVALALTRPAWFQGVVEHVRNFARHSR